MKKNITKEDVNVLFKATMTVAPLLDYAQYNQVIIESGFLLAILN